MATSHARSGQNAEIVIFVAEAASTTQPGTPNGRWICVRRMGRRPRMATIRASCPTCGDVELTTRDVTVQVCSTNNQGSYSFRCPDCSMAVSKPAEAWIVDLLVSSGVRASVWHMPAELDEQRAGPPNDYDDLLEFHFELQREGWMDRLTTALDDGR